MPIYPDNSKSIGHTPLIRLNRVTAGCLGTVLAKIEGRNPGYSVKCRIGAAMVDDAEMTGRLKPGMEIIEPTSGNTGIALGFVAHAARNYKLTLTMPDTMSIERRRVLAAYGATLVLTPGRAEGMNGAVKKAEEIRASDPKRYFMPKLQFSNPANPAIHERTTGPEIWEDTNGGIDVFVAGVGTGGTITGVSRYIKHTKKKAIISVAVEPALSPLLTQQRAGLPLKPAGHKIQGIGANFIPAILDLSIIDRVEQVSVEESVRDGPPSGASRGRHPQRHQLRRRLGCGGAAGQAAGVRRQDPGHRAAGLGRALPLHHPVRGHRLAGRPPGRGYFFFPARLCGFAFSGIGQWLKRRVPTASVTWQ